MKSIIWIIALSIAYANVHAQVATSQPTSQSAGYEPATEPHAREGEWMTRHRALVERAHSERIDLYLEGDSITDHWERQFKPNFLKYFGDWHAADFGISGDRTEQVLYRIENGELDGCRPKVVMLLIGTNNLVTKPNLPASSVEETAAGVKAIIDGIEARQPQATILLLAIFPCADRPLQKQVDAVNAIIKTFDDGKRVRYLDINSKFLDADGRLTKDVMPDLLHPNEHGYDIWGQAVHDTLAEMLGEAATKPAKAH